MATQKIQVLREKILHEDRKALQKRFDAVLRYLQKNPKEFQEYQPDRVNEKLKEKTSFDNVPLSRGQTGVLVETPPSPSFSPTPYLPNSNRELEPPRKLRKIEKFIDDSSEYEDIRSKSCTRTRKSFASKHLMRPGTSKLRQDLIRKYLSGNFKTIYVTDFSDPEFKQLFDSMGDEAQDRAKSMFNRGYYNASKGDETYKISTNGLILSIDPRLQLKITSPGRFEEGVWVYGYHLLQIEICSFHIEELQKRENGDYCHWDSHKVPQAIHNVQRTPLRTLDNNSNV